MRPPLVLPVCALFALVACAPPSFEVELKGEAVVPAGDGGTPLDAFPAIGSFTNLDFNQNQDFQNQGITKEQVTSARLVSFQLKVLAPADQDFTFLDSLECYARAKDQERRVAFKQNIASLPLKTPSPVLSLDLEDAELQPFITAPSVSLLVRGKGRMPSSEVRLQADVKLEVTAGGR